MNSIIVFLTLFFISKSVLAADFFSFLSEVLSSHPEIRQQELNVSGAQQEASIARQQFYPTPSVSMERANASPNDAQYKDGNQVILFRLQQPLWTGGRLTAQLNKAQAMLDSRQAALQETRQLIAMTTVESWGAWCSAEVRLQTVNRNLELHRRLQKMLERRVEEGASASAELTLTMSRVAQTQAQAQSLQSQIRVAHLRLSQLLGKPFAAVSCQGWTDLVGLPDAHEDQMEESALGHQPALMRLRAQIRQVEEEVNERRADLRPEVYARAERQKGSYATVDAPTINRVFLGFSSRLGAGLSTVQQVNSAVLRRQAIEQEYETLERKVREQIHTLRIQLMDVQSRLPSLVIVVNNNLSTQEAWDRQFLAGRKSWLDVMNAARELMQSEIELADARVTEKSLKWRLALAVHGVDNVLASALFIRH